MFFQQKQMVVIVSDQIVDVIIKGNKRAEIFYDEFVDAQELF
jgi:hypothetical protein